ncbi:MAG TPA: hypothetical protein PKD24_15450 [Pyrinomonadaceae bacterium]|nr:hypothetical protein [Pyrinomonadaceae bacterium]HMP66816.1 hypothetical protein [Pyrinomonadaceae bacterium]
MSFRDLKIETFVDLDTNTKEAYKLFVTATTLVIDKAGKVEKIWVGAFNSETKSSVEEYFDISALVADAM